ncbi:MAG: hypothetical protein QM660_13465 [Dysgonomonas sp.]
MKKLVLFAVAAVAISFASCGGNQSAADAEAAAKRAADSIAAEAAKLQEEAAAKLDTAAANTDSLVQEVKAEVKK